MSDEELAAEARLLGCYLVGREPGAPLVDRYARANRALLAAPAEPRDGAILRFVHRHPWSLGFLDAACALLRPGRLLRNKLLVMAAVLEASTDFADDFLPRPCSAQRVLWVLAWQGVRGAARTLVGLVLYSIAVRS